VAVKLLILTFVEVIHNSATWETPIKPGIMQSRSIFILMFFAAAIGLFQACSKDSGSATPINGPDLPSSLFNYNVSFPQHIAMALPQQDNTPANNPVTNAGATLGRVLFYDKQLSKNNTISCASCHKPDKGFSDNAIKSSGFMGGLTGRHSMPILNLRFYRSGRMFWDERASTLEDQVLMPIQDNTEMGMTLPELVEKLKAVPYYASLFNAAFQSEEITSDRISRALSQFLRSIVTYQSKYDRVKQGLENFTPEEQTGEQLFLTAGGGATCGGCHRPPMFITSNPVAPFGLMDPNDRGINSEGRFKSSTLRNIMETTPLFHNGSVPSVEAMLASNIPAHGVPPPDRAAILAFLRTLSDNTVATEPRFSNPFR
jgi:cytochrome c peroxidase